MMDMIVRATCPPSLGVAGTRLLSISAPGLILGLQISNRLKSVAIMCLFGRERFLCALKCFAHIAHAVVIAMDGKNRLRCKGKAFGTMITGD